jgi:two-component system, cell cycle response regulator
LAEIKGVSAAADTPEMRERIVSQLGRVSLYIMTAALVLFVVYASRHFGGSISEELIGRWLNAAIGIAPGLYCVGRALTGRRERLPWLLLGCGATAWGIGGIYYLAAYYHATSVPFPSPADIGYLALYPFMYPGLLLLMKGRLRGFRRTLWLDGVIGGLAVASLATAIVFQAVVKQVGGSAAAVATNLAYPLADAVLIALVVLVAGMSGWRPGRELWLIGLGLLVFFVGDSTYLVESAQGTYTTGHLLDASWPAGLLLIAYAASRPTPARKTIPADGWAILVMPVFFILAMVGLEAWDHSHQLNTLAIVLTSLTLVAGVARLALTFAENMTMLGQSRNEALTDQLTHLGNRRSLLADLEAALDGGERHLLVLLDLNGFKHYNDSFGHLAGDALLTRLAGALASTADTSSRAYRLGGDEFCVLVALTDRTPEPLIAAAAAALCEQGDGFEINASYGTLILPEEASTVSEALRIADERMYAQKQSGRPTAQEQSSRVLLGVLAERQPDISSHMARVADLAEGVALRLGLTPEAVREIRIAAALHDIGKVAIPDGIINNTGPLNADEMSFVRKHTLIGQRIMAAAPALTSAARLVRASHERYDGTGYPDGLAGNEIPIGSRIILVCDAYDAMIATRPYAPARSVEEALTELTAHAGTQFDPNIVAIFNTELAHRLTAIAA